MERLLSGPYRLLDGPAGKIPWYVVPFDKAGRCTGPRTAAEVAARVQSREFTDVVIFSHGWNNDWVQATDRYGDFIQGYLGQVMERPPGKAPKRALLIGLFWPSKLLADSVRPAFETTAPAGEDETVAAERDEVAELGDWLAGDAATRFYELVQQEYLLDDEAREMAELFLPLLAADGTEVGETAPTHPDDVVAAWATDPDVRADPMAGPGGPEQAAQLEGAGLLRRFDPREIVRAASVWLMKDRAGVVGTRGLAPLLGELAVPDVRVHLVGHSFGAKVVLAGLCAPGTSVTVRSVLLLQPAVSHLCFASPVPETTRPGGYAAAPDRVELPILSTFSRRDEPLTQWFHHALRRGQDVGEMEALREEGPPNRYAALGGFGPRPLDDRIRLTEVNDPGVPYRLGADAPEVYGIDASRTIHGHGAISTPSTWWMLSQLIHAD
ncbi:hypothetical protein [Thermomonospora amylolytica]|uniref:hypothetical protein n=1 Tax=Thermomonospora amylolytica TaxID=1411117 RepID=UPI000E6D14D5|nr:hypothetical protein [Thermomonospora amylolytica]